MREEAQQPPQAEANSRSIQRRVALQKGEPMPTFEPEKCQICGHPEADLVHHKDELRRREDEKGMSHELSDSLRCHEFERTPR